MPDVLRRIPGIVLGFAAIFLFSPIVPVSGESNVSEVPDNGALTLERSLALTLRNHPELAAWSEEVRAREAESLQAGLRPNPVLSLESENLGGTGEFSGTGASETTLSVSQLFEMGDKRRLRKALAEAEVAAAGKEYSAIRNMVLARTQKRFYAVLAAQERLALADELTRVADHVLATVEERIAGGKAAETERVRTRILVADLKLEQEKARHALDAARRALAAETGLEPSDFGPATGDLHELHDLPELTVLEDRLAGSPELARRMAEVEARRRGISLEHARRIPDLEVGLGARYLGETEDTAFVLGISVPLPLFDRNQGGIAAAESRLSRARMEKRSTLLKARTVLADAWKEMRSARTEAEALREEILPAASRSLKDVEYGYRAGKFDVLDVLDVQRTLIESRSRYLEALARFHQAAAEIRGLLGLDLFVSNDPEAFSDSVKE